MIKSIMINQILENNTIEIYQIKRFRIRFLKNSKTKIENLNLNIRIMILKFHHFKKLRL